MTGHLTEFAIISAVSGLTEERLRAFIAAEVVIPIQTDSGAAFRQIDVARLRLLCELSDDLDLDEAALRIVMSLIDQLHEVRFTLHAIARALHAEPHDVRTRIGATLGRSHL